MKKIRLGFVLLLAFLYSCNEPMKLADQTEQENFVSVQEAITLAEVQAPLVISSNGRTSGRSKVKSTFSVKPDNDNPSMHIINYENKGFIIISGDNRIAPLFAYSEDSSFPTDKRILPDGLVAWLQAVDQSIKALRKDTIKQSRTVKQLWKKYNDQNLVPQASTVSVSGKTQLWSDWTTVGDCNNGDSGYTNIFQVNPLLQTLWDQGTGYNNLVPFGACSQTSNGNYWTGCVATAVAQVMRYHQFPASYSWSAMPNTFGSNETSRLMRDLGYSYNLDMNYGCNGSGAYQDKIPRTFSNFGYPTPAYGDYNYFDVRNNIEQRRPVILGGYKQASWWIFGAEGGHSWVTDGAYHEDHYSCQPDPNTPGEWIAVYTGYFAALHMNWGWSGSFNGWYSAYNFNPGSRSYNWKPDMVTNIRIP